MDPRFVAHHIGRIVTDDAIFLEDSLSNSPIARRYHTCGRPHSFFSMGSSGGGWGPGAAVGAKFAEPDRDVILASGDGFYTFGIPTVALWTAQRYGKPYLSVVFENSRYSTGTNAVDHFYPDGYAAAAGYPGGRFSPAPDFAAEAKACGAHGERVTDPAELERALERGLSAVRDGQPAVVSAVVT
jgi:acetolactate synthase-1/2/3 large subunit